MDLAVGMMAIRLLAKYLDLPILHAMIIRNTGTNI